MPAPQETIWDMEPHTLAKHAILRNYMNAWLPIMTSWNNRVLFIDGFAGPGRYRKREDGSPIIALKAALEHKQRIGNEVFFIFIEARSDRAEYLRNLLANLSLPPNIRYQVVNGRFDQTLANVLQYLDEQRKMLAPAFVFADPFGYSHTPFEIIQRIMENRYCEVLITFMFDEINRFLSREDQWPHFDALFGSSQWRNCLRLSGEDRKRCIHDTYQAMLKDRAHIKFVRSFEMINSGNRTDYFLFFGTNGYAGLKKMKEAMWRVDEVGAFRFSDRTRFDQPYLINPEPDHSILKGLIVQHFKGRTFDIEELEKFVIIETPFLETHYKTTILKPMEGNDELQVLESPRQRRFTYPAKTILHIPK